PRTTRTHSSLGRWMNRRIERISMKCHPERYSARDPGVPAAHRFPRSLTSTLGMTCLVLLSVLVAPLSAQPVVLKPDDYKPYVDHFNTMEDEFVVNLIPNDKSWDWMAANVPAFECPDKAIEEIYWYRWWTYRKCLKQMPDHIAMTEFIKRNPV